MQATKDDNSSSSFDRDEIESTSEGLTGSDTHRDGSRDEIKEIERLSHKETTVIRTWRIVLLALLLLTAVSVTTVTYLLLKQKDENAYKALVSVLSAFLILRVAEVFSRVL